MSRSRTAQILILGPNDLDNLQVEVGQDSVDGGPICYLHIPRVWDSQSLGKFQVEVVNLILLDLATGTKFRTLRALEQVRIAVFFSWRAQRITSTYNQAPP
jgi:hypothetical protein